MSLYKYKNIGNLTIPIYSKVAFQGLKEAGLLAYHTLKYMEHYIKEGITTNELDKICHDFIIKHKAIPATLGYHGYPKSCCISLNHEICHGIPKDKPLISGDILNLDVTVILNGWYGDSSKMFMVPPIPLKAQKLMNITQLALHEAIKILRPNIKLNEIGKTIEQIAHANNFSVVEEFCGHGIGHQFHQEPSILHFYQENELILKEGMVFTIEPMLNLGKKHVKMLNNGWTAVTKDFSLSAQYEHTVGITHKGYIVFTLPNDQLP